MKPAGSGIAPCWSGPTAGSPFSALSAIGPRSGPYRAMDLPQDNTRRVRCADHLPPQGKLIGHMTDVLRNTGRVRSAQRTLRCSQVRSRSLPRLAEAAIRRVQQGFAAAPVSPLALWRSGATGTQSRRGRRSPGQTLGRSHAQGAVTAARVYHRSGRLPSPVAGCPHGGPYDSAFLHGFGSTDGSVVTETMIHAPSHTLAARSARACAITPPVSTALPIVRRPDHNRACRWRRRQRPSDRRTLDRQGGTPQCAA